jgi:serine/threonine-protein kinase
LNVVRLRRLGVSLLKNGLLVLALSASAGLSTVATMRMVLSTREVTVPSLLGQRIGEATTELRQADLLIKVEGQRHDPQAPRGHIAAQEPRPGATLKENRSVRVWLSLGPERLEVPALQGQSLRGARLMLNQAQIPLSRVAEVGSLAPEGTVLLQRPKPGETGTLADGVSLLVSRGPDRLVYLMPDLIGRNGPRVLDSLEQAGWKPEVRQRSYPGVAPGIVLRQQPPAGHPIDRRQPIALEINTP